MLGRSLWNYTGFVLGLALFPISAFAADPASLSIGTEIKFPASANGLPFSPCGDDPKYSCAVLKKVAADTGSFKSLSRCFFRVNSHISKLETSSGRTLTIKQITHNDDKRVVSATLDGAKIPIILSCEVEYSQMNTTRTMPGATLTEELLTGFKEFKLGNVKTEKSQAPTELIPVLKDPPKAPGGIL